MPPTTTSELGDTRRTDRENHTGCEQQSSIHNRVVKQRNGTTGEDNNKNATTSPEKTTTKSGDTIVRVEQHNFDPENSGGEGVNNEEVKDDLEDGHRQSGPMNKNTNGRRPNGGNPDDDHRSDTEDGGSR